MKRTTIYLDESDKRRLAALAVKTGVSEAELIRRGVRLVILEAADRRPRAGYARSNDGRSARETDDLLSESGFGR